MPRPPTANGVANQSTRKRMATENSADASDAIFNEQYSAATDEEKKEWQGFCEIESDPVSQTPPSEESLTRSSRPSSTRC